MTWWLWIIVYAVVLGGLAWVFRLAGQQVTGNKPFFRDMPFGVAFGYVLGAALLIFFVWFYFQPVEANGAPVASVMFFRWAVQGFIVAAIAAFLFKQFGA